MSFPATHFSRDSKRRLISALCSFPKLYYSLRICSLFLAIPFMYRLQGSRSQSFSLSKATGVFATIVGCAIYVTFVAV